MDILGYISGEISWSAAKKQAMLDDLAYAANYQDEIQDEDGEMVPNPVTKKQHANNWILRLIGDKVHRRREDVGHAAVEIEVLDPWE